MLLLKGIMGGLAVIAVTLLAEHYPRIAGMVVWIPVVTLTSYIAIAWSGNAEKLPQVALGSLLALPVLGFYALVLWQSLERLPWPWALLVGLAAWFIAALVYIKIVGTE
jgi:uncharacterized membrane protein (GlpM family)